MKLKKKILLFFNILFNVFATLLLLSVVSKFFNPHSFWFLSVLGLGFLYLFIFVFCIFIIYLIFKKFVVLIYPAISIILSFFILSDMFAVNIKSHTYKPDKSMKILSYNVKQFGLYAYKKDWSINYSYRDSILKYIINEKPDICCLQEIYESTPEFLTFEYIKKQMPEYKIHILKTKQKKNNYWGMAILSKYPIIKTYPPVFNEKNSAFYVDIALADTVLRVYNLHLASLGLNYKDFELFSNLVEIDSVTFNKYYKVKNSTYSNLIRKIKKSFIKRSEQLNMVLKSIEKSPYPVLVCGDFNDMPNSYTYYNLTQNLQDAFLASGSGFGNTYSGTKTAIFRIDYILYPKCFQAYNFKVRYDKKYSDHYPISCNIYRID